MTFEGDHFWGGNLSSCILLFVGEGTILSGNCFYGSRFWRGEVFFTFLVGGGDSFSLADFFEGEEVSTRDLFARVVSMIPIASMALDIFEAAAECHHR